MTRQKLFVALIFQDKTISQIIEKICRIHILTTRTAKIFSNVFNNMSIAGNTTTRNLVNRVKRVNNHIFQKSNKKEISTLTKETGLTNTKSKVTASSTIDLTF